MTLFLVVKPTLFTPLLDRYIYNSSPYKISLSNNTSFRRPSQDRFDKQEVNKLLNLLIRYKAKTSFI